MREADESFERLRTEIRRCLEDSERKASSQEHVKVPLGVPNFGEDEIVEVLHSLLSKEVTMGAKVRQFENDFAKYIGVPNAIMVNSGSSANLLILAVLANPLCPPQYRLHAGDEVIVAALTWPTTLWPVINMNLVPVLVDVDPRTLNMSVDDARRAITPKTKAIFVTHVLGNAADMEAFQSLAREHGLVLLEDSCESLGTTYQGKMTGCFSLAASYSFFFSHHITTMEGGMVVTSDDEIADLCLCLRSHGWTRHMKSRRQLEAQYSEIDPRFLFVNIGYNMRPTEIQAAFGLHQLPKLNRFNQQRREFAAVLMKGLKPLHQHLQLIQPTMGVEHTWFGFPVILTERHATERSAFVEYLESRGIETRPIVAGNLAQHPALRHFPHRVSGLLPNAQAVMQRGVYWGIHPSMKPDELEYAIKTVSDYFDAT